MTVLLPVLDEPTDRLALAFPDGAATHVDLAARAGALAARCAA